MTLGNMRELGAPPRSIDVLNYAAYTEAASFQGSAIDTQGTSL